ncbi:MAG TPA: hypothetical protein VFW62_10785, partial [bacterium]|nr:hypothetical protein [bacterium]
AAQAQGEIPADWDLAGLAKFVVTFDIGIVTYSTIRPTAEDKRRIWESFRNLLTRGLGTVSPDEALRPASEGG